MARPRSFDRDAVLDGIRDLFWERGYAATSLSDLEEVSGLKRTSLYNAFGNKDELYALALERYRIDSQASAERILAAADDPLAGLRQLLEQTVESALADRQRKGCFINNATNERAAQCTRTAQFVADNREGFVERFARQFERARELGHDVPHPPRQLAVYLFSLYSGLMSLVRSGASREAVT